MNPAKAKVQGKTFYQFLLIFVLLSCFLVGTGWSETYQFVRKWGSSLSGDGQFNNPRGVAADASGNVYVADTWNHRIQEFAPIRTKNGLPWLQLLLGDSPS